MITLADREASLHGVGETFSSASAARDRFAPAVIHGGNRWATPHIAKTRYPGSGHRAGEALAVATITLSHFETRC